MRVKVLFFGVLKDIVGKTEDSLDVPAGTTLEDLFAHYSEGHETLRVRRSSILFARNREFTTGGAALSEGDEVAFLPPVSGGSGSPDGQILEIVRTPIDSRALVAKLQRPEDGAVVVFEGVVRNNTRGRTTLYLEYECYEPMAKNEMRRIGTEIAQRFAIGRLGMAHRVGRIEIGEASVVIVATAPHRKPAFEAALEAIDRLKREVPIWKKEYFAGGAVWLDGEWDEKLLSR